MPGAPVRPQQRARKNRCAVPG